MNALVVYYPPRNNEIAVVKLLALSRIGNASKDAIDWHDDRRKRGDNVEVTLAAFGP